MLNLSLSRDSEHVVRIEAKQHGGLQVTPATDVFSLGAVLFFAATGKDPFHGESRSELREQIFESQPDLTGLPESLRHVVDRCLAKTPAERPSLSALLGFFAREVKALTDEGRGRRHDDTVTIPPQAD